MTGGALAIAEVRPPRGAELRAARMLLPEAFARNGAPDLLLAALHDPLRIAGVAAYEQTAVAGGIGWNIMLHVAAAHRRRGIGTQLLSALAERGRASRLSGLSASHDADRQSSAGPFLERAGFAFLDRESRWEIELRNFLDSAGPICDRLVQRKKIPPTVRVVSLAEAPRHEVVQFYADQRFGAPDEGEARWPAAWDAAAVRETSVVLMDEDRVIGLGMGHADGAGLFAHYRLVGAPHRRGWANLLMCAEGARRLCARGVTRAKFFSSQRAPDAQAFANLYGATLLESRCRYVLALPKSPRRARGGSSL